MHGPINAACRDLRQLATRLISRFLIGLFYSTIPFRLAAYRLFIALLSDLRVTDVILLPSLLLTCQLAQLNLRF